MLRKLRDESGLTQEQLAVILGLSSGTIGRWERESKVPSMTIDEWLVFCETVGIDFAELPSLFSAKKREKLMKLI